MANESNLEKVFTVRHGDYSRATKELTDDGIAQSQSIAQKLRTMIPVELKVIVISSQFQRAIRTATIVAGHLGAKIKICDDLERKL